MCVCVHDLKMKTDRRVDQSKFGNAFKERYVVTLEPIASLGIIYTALK